MPKISIPSLLSIQEQGVSIKTILKGVLTSYILSVILLAIFAVIITYTNFPESSIPTVVLTISILSILYAGKIAAKKAKSKGWLVGSVSGLMYMFILYLISLIFSQRAVFDAHVAFIFLIGLVAGAVGGIIGINFKKSEKRYR